MNAVVESVRSLWVPLQGINLLVPNVAIAEVINYQPLSLVEGGPDWLAGKLRWRERELPVIHMEGICGYDLPQGEHCPRLSVLNSVRTDTEIPFYAMVTAGIPRLLIADEDALGASRAADRDLPETVADVIGIGSEFALIPNLALIEQQVEAAWKQLG